jgi:hypothetical protein
VLVRRARALAASLLGDHKHEADSLLTGSAQTLRCGYLRHKDPLGIAGAATVHAAASSPARKERRHAVEVCREHDHWILGRPRNDVESAVDNGLALDGPSQVSRASRR